MCVCVADIDICAKNETIMCIWLSVILAMATDMQEIRNDMQPLFILRLLSEILCPMMGYTWTKGFVYVPKSEGRGGERGAYKQEAVVQL